MGSTTVTLTGSVTAMVGMAGEDRCGAVELLGEDKAREGMGECERSEREQERGARSRLVRPSVRRADREDNVLNSAFAVRAEPPGEGFRAHLLTAAVEQHKKGWSTPALAIKPHE